MYLLDGPTFSLPFNKFNIFFVTFKRKKNLNAVIEYTVCSVWKEYCQRKIRDHICHLFLPLYISFYTVRQKENVDVVVDVEMMTITISIPRMVNYLIKINEYVDVLLAQKIWRKVVDGYTSSLVAWHSLWPPSGCSPHKHGTMLLIHHYLLYFHLQQNIAYTSDSSLKFPLCFSHSLIQK